MFKRLVDIVEIAALVCIGIFVVMLFTNEPTGGGRSDEPAAAAVDGAAIYARNCAGCHGVDGEGGVAPQLGDGQVAAAYPNPDEQVRVVTEGIFAMPAFDGRLSEAEIEAVVDYTRTELGR